MIASGCVDKPGLDTCLLTISAAISTVLYWRQVRVALDTLLNVCLAVQQPAGGRAFVGAPHGVSGGIWSRDLSNVSIDAWADYNITGMRYPSLRDYKADIT